MIYNFYVFNRDGVCLYYKEWHRTNMTPDSTQADQKLMFGFLFSLKHLVNKFTPERGTPGFHSCYTNKFKLNYLETMSGYRFVLNTDVKAGDMRECMRQIYSGIFVEYAAKNPLYKSGDMLDNSLFADALDRYLTSLPIFSS